MPRLIACRGRRGPAHICSGNSEREAESMGEFVVELWMFMRERKKFWLLPIVIVLVLFGALVVLTQGSAVAPFIYTLFYGRRVVSVRAAGAGGVCMGGYMVRCGSAASG